MGIRFGSSDPGNNLRIGSQIVGGIAIGSTVVYRRAVGAFARSADPVEPSRDLDL